VVFNDKQGLTIKTKFIMANVTVNIPNYKGGVGTLEWLEAQLKLAKITKSHTNGKNPGLWIELPDQRKKFLCIIFNAPPDTTEDQIRVGEFWAMIPKSVSDADNYKTGLFNFLTPAAEAKCTEFIRAAAETFAKGLESL